MKVNLFKPRLFYRQNEYLIIGETKIFILPIKFDFGLYELVFVLPLIAFTSHKDNFYRSGGAKELAAVIFPRTQTSESQFAQILERLKISLKIALEISLKIALEIYQTLPNLGRLKILILI